MVYLSKQTTFPSFTLINLVFGFKIEDSLSFGEKFDDVVVL
jgi:hypothetical protein